MYYIHGYWLHIPYLEVRTILTNLNYFTKIIKVKNIISGP